jgi:hypothetical protein
MADPIMVLGMFLFAWLWLSGCGLTAWVAAQKNRGAFSWFLAALLISPVLSMIALAAVPVRRDELTADRHR